MDKFFCDLDKISKFILEFCTILSFIINRKQKYENLTILIFPKVKFQVQRL